MRDTESRLGDLRRVIAAQDRRLTDLEKSLAAANLRLQVTRDELAAVTYRMNGTAPGIREHRYTGRRGKWGLDG